MTLENLLGIGKLKQHSPSKQELSRLLHSASRSIADARRQDLQPNSRLDLAYKGIMQCALVALMASGFRPSTSQPGHQQTTIQSLPKTIGLPAPKLLLYDGFRRARNLGDYEGVEVETQVVVECIAAAESLLGEVRDWLRKAHAELA